jgi:hypothetical protein
MTTLASTSIPSDAYAGGIMRASKSSVAPDSANPGRSKSATVSAATAKIAAPTQNATV